MKHNNVLAVLGLLACSLSAAVAQNDPQFPPPGGPRGHGFGPGPGGPPPIIAALDANHDGVIDQTEISNAAAALTALDKNQDGKLTPDEFGGRMGPGPGPGRGPRLPKEIIDQYDTDQDGVLNETERQALHADIESGKVQLPPPGPRGPRGPGAPGVGGDPNGGSTPDAPRPPRPPRAPRGQGQGTLAPQAAPQAF